MKVICNIFSGYELSWRIRIAPRLNKDGKPLPITSKWKPTGGEPMLIFNPRVSINIKPNYGDNTSSITIPLNMTYALVDALNVMYDRIQTKGLYTRDGKKLYIDAKIASQCIYKIPVYTSSILLIPSKISPTDLDETKSIKVIYDGQEYGEIRHDELRELCDVMNRIDFTSYTLLCSLLEKVYDLDDKLENIEGKINKIVSSQEQIIELLGSLGAKTKLSTNPDVINLDNKMRGLSNEGWNGK